MLFPPLSGNGEITRAVLSPAAPGRPLPNVRRVESLSASVDDGVHGGGGVPLLVEHSRNVFARPGIRGHRIVPDGDDVSVGRDWSPRFLIDSEPRIQGGVMTMEASDGLCGLHLTTVLETLPGGTLRIRHILRNVAQGTYVLDGLEVSVPLLDRQTEILDFTGRHERERQPQRHHVSDGVWLREFRWGKPGFDGPVVVVGTKGFGYSSGVVTMVQPSWSGNSVFSVQRGPDCPAMVSCGELLLPGEIALRPGEEYSTPWVMVTASRHGLDGAAASMHEWERALPAHPVVQPVTLNVWEGVQFDHDFGKLSHLADLAAGMGVERFVLDDGWFHLRRNDSAGLGDWWVDEDVWPKGLTPLADKVHSLGMQFGLWFEPEMVNPDSDLFREHPDWVLSPHGRMPLLERNQLVLDLANPDAFEHVHDAMAAVLAECGADYVKWDHNRFLLEAGTGRRMGAPSVHDQTDAFYRLLDRLRGEFPHTAWESCASGGGRIDAGVVERVERFWSSDVTDALSRQGMQQWLVQTMAPEYLGAHVSQPSSQQTGRTFSLDFRAATAVLFSFGIEWDVSTASTEDIDRLAQWIEWHKRNRGFLHSGRFVRLDVDDAAVLAYGVVSHDATRAIIEHVQIDESSSDRGVWLRMPFLDRDRLYVMSWSGPSSSFGVVPPSGAVASYSAQDLFAGRVFTGHELAEQGLWLPRCMSETARLIDIRASGDGSMRGIPSADENAGA